MIVGLFHSIASNKVMCLQVEAVKDWLKYGPLGHSLKILKTSIK